MVRHVNRGWVTGQRNINIKNYKNYGNKIVIKDIRHHKFRGDLGKSMFGVAGLIAPVFGILIDWQGKINEATRPNLASILGFIKENALYFYFILILCLVVGYILSRDGKRIQWTTLQTILDDLQSISYTSQETENDKHRVTLFQYKKWCWQRHKLNVFAWYKSHKSRKVNPGCGWLVPVLRSNDQGKNTKVLFAVTDSSDFSEGIVGRCWATKNTIALSELPKVIVTSASQQRQRYAKRCFLPQEYVDSALEKRKLLARSLFAIPVMANNGEQWGVIIWDSVSPTGINSLEAEKAYSAVMNTISHLTEDL